MNGTAQVGPQLHVTVNVTDWTEDRRQRLLAAIERFEAEADIDTTPNLEEVEITGWTKDLVERAFEHLAGSKATAQIKVIKRAIENGGSVTRSEVYAIAGYEPTRVLKGFTRPTNRATNALRDSGDLPEDAEDLLEPIYDESNKSFQRTQGFRIPLEIVKLFTD